MAGLENVKDGALGVSKRVSSDVVLATTSLAVYVCTFRRNGPLKRLLDSLSKAAAVVQPGIEVAVVVVDDNSDGRAREVVENYDASGFVRGLHYRHSGAQNISKARNMGIEACLELGDWVGMVDDDEVVVENWIQELFVVQNRVDADAVTGPVLLRYPEGSPSWLEDEPFGSITEAELRPDGSTVPVCSTGNSIIRTSWLNDNADIRFRSDLGTLGGEDMVFYGAAVSAGLRAHYAVEAVAYGEEPPERSTFSAMMRRCYWMGNTECITNLSSGSASRFRIVLRAKKRMLLAVLRPAKQLATQKPAQFRFAGAKLMQGFGMIVGVLGVKVEHQ